MIAVSDTTALTSLVKAGLDGILPDLFGFVLIPKAVAEEFLDYHETLPDFCTIAEPADLSILQELLSRVDRGEAAAIALALSRRADILLIDDRKGRREAERLGLTCLALPAVLVAAKRQGLISSLRTALSMLASKGRYRVDSSTESVLLRSVGE